MGMALRGVRVLVTRAREQAGRLAEALEAEGAEVVSVAAIEMAAPRSWCGLDAAIASMGAFDWVVFTSANAVRATAERARRQGVMPRARRVAVVGPSTRDAVVASGMATAVDVMPERYVAEALAERLETVCAGAQVLLVRAAVAREVLPERLRAAGAVVTVAEAYRTVVPSESVERVREALARGVEVVTFTSGSTVENLAGLLEAAEVSMPDGVRMFSIGPVTSAAMRERGWEPAAESEEATIAGLVRAVMEGSRGEIALPTHRR